MRFSHSLHYEPFIYFDLEISEEQANNLSQDKNDKFLSFYDEKYVVVAVIDSVVKPRIKIDTSVTEEDFGEEHYGEIVDLKLETSNVFLAIGSSLEVYNTNNSMESTQK